MLVLTPDKAVELGLRHSREYQTALETLYETALILTLQRFEFDMHWFSSRNLLWTHFGSGADELNTLQEQASHGFTKTLLAGGQLMVDFANTVVFQFAGPDSYSTSSNILITFMQPLLRQAGRQIVLEALTQAERNVLYAVRTFARFRKQFYVNVTTGPTGFLSLLLQVQNIRNLEANQESYLQNLQVYEALRAGGMVSEVQVDETFQRVQQTRANLISAQTQLDNTLDAFKLTLGLPPDVKISLDDAQLKPFELVDPALVAPGRGGSSRGCGTDFRHLSGPASGPHGSDRSAAPRVNSRQPFITADLVCHCLGAPRTPVARLVSGGSQALARPCDGLCLPRAKFRSHTRLQPLDGLWEHHYQELCQPRMDGRCADGSSARRVREARMTSFRAQRKKLGENTGHPIMLLLGKRR